MLRLAIIAPCMYSLRKMGLAVLRFLAFANDGAVGYQCLDLTMQLPCFGVIFHFFRHFKMASVRSDSVIFLKAETLGMLHLTTTDISAQKVWLGGMWRVWKIISVFLKVNEEHVGMNGVGALKSDTTSNRVLVEQFGFATLFSSCPHKAAIVWRSRNFNAWGMNGQWRILCEIDVMDPLNVDVEAERGFGFEWCCSVGHHPCLVKYFWQSPERAENVSCVFHQCSAQWRWSFLFWNQDLITFDEHRRTLLWLAMLEKPIKDLYAELARLKLPDVTVA